METIFALILLIGIIAAAARMSNSNSRKLKVLKQEYDAALKGTSKRAALQAGRAYYSALRKGKMLTIYDEQAITNDLSTMNLSSE